ncbi:hypothetical protein Pst134EB_006269 [Puccinia striiformis f. sp. tritici]|nr:hypothetical protein Pst134EB_006269 [Puccinia striiformis f. sp. tritici]
MFTPIPLSDTRGLRRTTIRKVCWSFLIVLCHCILFAIAMESSSLQHGRISGASSPMTRSLEDDSFVRGGFKDEEITECDDGIPSALHGESNVGGSNKPMSIGINDLEGGRARGDEELIARDNLLSKFTEAQRFLQDCNEIYIQGRIAVLKEQETPEVLKIEAIDKIHQIVKELKKQPNRDHAVRKLIGHLESPGFDTLGPKVSQILRSAEQEFLEEPEKKTLWLGIDRWRRHRLNKSDYSLKLRELRGMLKTGRKEFCEGERAAIHRLSLIEHYGFPLSKGEIDLIRHMPLSRHLPLGRHHASPADLRLIEAATQFTAVERVEKLVVNMSQYFEDLYAKSTTPTIKRTLDTICKSLEALLKKLKEGDLWTADQTRIFHDMMNFRAQKEGVFPSIEDPETKQTFRELLEEGNQSKSTRMFLKAFANLSSNPENLSKSAVGKELSTWWTSNHWTSFGGPETSRLKFGNEEIKFIEAQAQEYDQKVKMIGTIRSNYDLIETAKHYLDIDKPQDGVDEAMFLERKYYATQALKGMEGRSKLTNSRESKTMSRKAKNKAKDYDTLSQEETIKFSIQGFILKESGVEYSLLDETYQLLSLGRLPDASNARANKLYSYLTINEVDELNRLLELTEEDQSFAGETQFITVLNYLYKADFRSKFNPDVINENNIRFLETLSHIKESKTAFAKSKLHQLAIYKDEIDHIIKNIPTMD